MAIFRGTGGSGSSSDSTIVDAVTAQATIATTKADEAEGFRDEAEGFKNTASSKANLATTKASEASSDATNADNQRQLCVALRLEAYDSAVDALASANAAEASATTANSSAVQTVAGSNTQVVGVYNNIANVNTVAGVNTDVTTVAGISSDVTTVAADASDIGTVSTNIANVNNVGNNIANVNAVHGNASNINTVAADGTDIGTVATNIANVNTVAGISSNVTTVAGLESKMDTVIADASDIGAVAGNIGDVTTVAGINADVDTVAGIAAKVTTVADNISDVQAADTNATNAATSASNASASATSASNSATTATTKATEASNSATAASNSATTATTKASQAAGSATTATNKATEASTSATNAATSATTATTKAGEAASSASAASGSASTATTKAAEADASATSAATSATNSSNAASTWNNFYNSYLGVADAQPSVDVLGNAIVAGALYYDTGAGSNAVGLYVYNGSSWVYSTNYNNVTAPYSLAQDLATNSYDISFGDNAKAKFGASDDLQIYHDGSNSYVKDAGTGYLILGNSDAGTIIKNSSGQNLLTTTASEIRLGHEGNTKLATKSTGIDVTGTVTASEGFAMGSGDQISSTGNMFIDIDSNNDSTAATLDLTRDGKTKKTARFTENGDVSFYEDTGTTPKFFWDASAERLGIGTTSPAYKLDVYEATGNGVQIKAGDALTDKALSVGSAGTPDKFVVQSGGNVGIGTSSPSSALDVVGEATVGSGTYGVKLSYSNSTTAGVIDTADSADKLSIRTSGTERMRIDASGNVGIGTASPQSKLHVNGTLRATDLYVTGGESYLCRTHSVTDTSLSVLRLCSISTGDMADGFGTGITFDAQDNSGVNQAQVAEINAVRAGADNVFNLELQTGDVARLTLGADGAVFATGLAGTERMRIDASGNVLVGKTSQAYATAGLELEGAGRVVATRDGASAGIFARLNSDGDIVNFRKGGTTVGSIGTTGGDMYVGTGDTSIRFDDATNHIRPCGVSGANLDATIDIGDSTRRFKDLYLSGGVHLGGTASANKLDDYEEGTFTPTVAGDSTGVIDTGTQGSYYTKVGNLVTIYMNFRVTTNFTSSSIGGLPFQANHPDLASSWLSCGSTLSSSTNTISAGIQNTTSVIRLYENQNLATPHVLNTTNDYYRFVFSYRTA